MDVELGTCTEVGVERSPFYDLVEEEEEVEEEDEQEEYEGDAKYVGRALAVPIGGVVQDRDREQLGVLEMLKEEGRIRRGEIG